MKNNEYNNRQILIMEKLISSYKEGRITLEILIGRLEELFYILEDIEYEWKKEFHDNWILLEQSYAVSIDRNIPIINFKDSINSSIYEIERLINSKKCN